MKKWNHKTTDKYTPVQFKPDGISKDEGLNCLSLCVDFCKDELDLDYDFKDTIIGNINWGNVFKLFHDNPEKIFSEVEKHFLNYYDKIPLHQMRKGDVASVDFGDGVKFPCVFVGNNKILITTREKGVKVVSLKSIKIYDVYRIKSTKKIITKIEYELGKNPEDFKLINEESYQYNGDIAECGPVLGSIAGYLISAIISLILSYFMGAFDKPDRPDDPAQAEQGLQVNTRSTQVPLKVVYGLQRVGGNDIYISTMGYHNNSLYIIQTLSEGECDSIYQDGGVDQILIDDKPYTDFGATVSYTFYPGSSTQNYNATLNTADPNWTDNLRYTSYMYWRFTWDEDQYRGIPNRIVDLKGIEVLDFRDESTAWSDNAVLCLYDFFTNNRYGLGVATTDIDETSWTTAANYFDTKGWSFNFSTQNNSNPWSVVQDMLRHFRGAISWFDGQYYLLISDINDESSVMTITDAHIVQDGSGKAQIRIIQPNRFSKPKGIRATFTDKDKNYVKDDILVGDETGVVASTSLMGYTDRETVSNIATYQLERLKLNRTISGTFRDDCLELAPHDLVTFTSTALAISAQTMRVVSTSFVGNGLINLTLQYESSELYDDNYDVDIEGVYTCSLPDPNSYVLISNSQISEETFFYRLRTESRLHITFTVADTEPWFRHCEIWYAITPFGDPAPDVEDYEHQFNTTNDFNIDHVEQGVTYYVKLVPVSIYGVRVPFAGATTLSHTVGGGVSAPQSLTALSAIPSSGGITLFADVLSDPDIEIYEFRLGEQWVGGIFLSAKRSPQEALPGVKPGTHTFFCNTKDTNGNYGETPRSATATVAMPLGWTLSDTFTDDYDGDALPNNITGITKANPGVVSSVAHTLVIGDKVAFSGLTQMTELNGTTQTVTAVGSVDLFSINDTSTYTSAETTGGACGTEVGTHDNTEMSDYGGDNYLMCSHDSTEGSSRDQFQLIETDDVIFGNTAHIIIAQSFVPNITADIESVVWYLSKVASPTDNITCYIYADVAGKPGGAALATSATYDGSTLNTTKALITFEFAVGDELTDGTTYWIMLARSGGADNTNYYLAREAGSNAYLLGKGAFTSDAVNYTGLGVSGIDDFYFQEFYYAPLLTGTYISPVYDTGVTADDYYLYLEADIVVTGSGTEWDDVLPGSTTWNAINIDTRAWSEIFTLAEAPRVNITILYKETIGAGWSEMPKAEILSARVTARYFAAQIEIEDPSGSIRVKVENFSLKLHTET